MPRERPDRRFAPGADPHEDRLSGLEHLGRDDAASGRSRASRRSGRYSRRPPWWRARWFYMLVVLVAVVVLMVSLTGSRGSRSRGGSASELSQAPARPDPATAFDPATAASANGTPLDPSMYAKGSCIAFSPTSGDRHETVFIDAGHGGIDPGATGITESGQTIHEADQTLPVALDAMALLRAQGYRVVVSRTRASTVLRLGPGDEATGVLTLKGMHDTIASRDVCANMAKANILLGIYFDAGTSPTNAGSITGYDSVRPFSAKNLKLAKLLQADVLAHMDAKSWDIPNDGVVTDKTLGGPADTTTAANYDHLLLLGPADPGWFTTPSEMPGALIEPLFITDPFEGTIAASTVGRETIAEGMAEAAEQYLQQTTSTPANSTAKSTSKSTTRSTLHT